GITVAGEDVVGTASQEETAQRTVEHVVQGKVDVILKGNISTPILNRAMIRIAVRDTMSLVTMFDASPIRGGRPMLMTDPGMTTVCSFGRMVGLVENAVDVAHSIMGLKRPRVAILSANEKVIDSLPSTRMGKQLSEYEWENAVVYGPLSFDLAVSEESARLKGVPKSAAAAEVTARADILVCPCIDSANVLYKVIGEMVKYGLGTFAGVTLGISVPYVILSRGDNVETKLQSIALSSIARERLDMAKRRAPRQPPSAAAAPQKPGGLAAVQAAANATADKMGLPAKHMNYVVANLDSEILVAAICGGCVVDSETLAPGALTADTAPEAELGRLAKAIGAMCVAAGPDVQSVLLTGELSRSEQIVRGLRKRLAHILSVSAVK
ncbi:MAG: phosphate acyltransferase, partial [Planctomycetota bacterium]|nr:phosphate acyltransferase [Planctomycetota bacterium]